MLKKLSYTDLPGKFIIKKPEWLSYQEQMDKCIMYELSRSSLNYFIEIP